MIEASRKPGLSFLEIVVGLCLLALAFLAGMLAEKIDLEKDRVEKTTRYLQSTQDLDPTVWSK
jgi:hypothetical protein